MKESTYNLVVSSILIIMFSSFLIVERKDLKKAIKIIYEKIKEKKQKVKRDKINRIVDITYKIIVLLIFIGIIIGICLYITKQIRFNKYKEEINITRKMVYIQNTKYEEIISKYKLENRKNPYKVEGFKYKEGTLNTGYVIEDSNGNEFVWVPIQDSKRKKIII